MITFIACLHLQSGRLPMIAPLPPGTLVFNRYRVVGLAGQGEFGLTYLAQDQKRFDELCMLREFSPPQPDPVVMEQLRQYFHQAAAALYELQHPQLPHHRIMFIHGDRLYLVREYIVGKSYSAMLKERRVEGRAFSPAEVMQLLLQTLPVLAHLHRLHLIHESLAPQSIVQQRDEQIPVLIDLGLVKRLVMQLQLHPVLPGTPIYRTGYAAPEQEKGGTAFPGTDIYSLGAIAIALLIGKEPQESAHRWLRSSHWEDQISLPADFAHVLKRMVHPNPQKRFISANQVLRALEPLAAIVLQSVTEGVRIPVTAGLVPSTEAAIAALPNNSASVPGVDMATEQEAPVEATPVLRRPKPPQMRKAPPRSRSHPGKRRKPAAKIKADFKASAILMGSVALLVSVVSWRALSWVDKGPNSTPAPANTVSSPLEPSSDTPKPASSPAGSPSPTMPTRESGMTPAPTQSASPNSANGLAERQQQVGVEMQFLSDLTDELFYTQHPDLNGQKLTPEQTDLQADWTAIANDILTKLEGLSPETRRKLGRYQREDYDRWTAPESGASLNSRELNVLVNNRFAELFPKQKGKTLNPKTFGQVWYALAEEELNKLKPAN
jgi:serine/threonine-protein kinase